MFGRSHEPGRPAAARHLGNSRVVARQNIELQLGCGFDGEVGVLPSKPCRLRLAAAVDSEQNQRGGPLLSCVEWFAFAVMVVSPGIKKGPGQGSLGFIGYGSSGSRIELQQRT